ncbi:MAG: PAS domain-containing protein [Candidatus Hodarchaeales archaeon]
MSGSKICVEDVIWFLGKTVENISVGVYIRESDSGKILYTNEAFAKIHGYSREELLGKISWSIIDGEQLPEALESLKKNGSFQGEIKGFRKDGRVVFLDLTVLDMSVINCVLGFVQDITEKKKMQNKLIESEAKYRALVDTIREGLAIVDAEENIAFVNPALAKMLGYTKNELVGMNLAELTNEENFKIIQSQTERRKGGEVSQYQISLFTKEGEEKVFLISAAPLYDSNKNYVGAISLCVNLSSMCFPIKGLSNVPKIFLKTLYDELDEQLLRAKGWLDILEAETGTTEAKERVKKVLNRLLRINYFSKQSFELLKEYFEVEMPLMTLNELVTKLEKQVGLIATANSCRLIVTNNIPRTSSSNLQVPLILLQIVEHCLKKSFTRFPKEFKVTFSLDPENKLVMECFDNGVIAPEFYEMSELPLESYYFIEVMMKKLNGEYTYSIDKPEKGLLIRFLIPLQAK